MAGKNVEHNILELILAGRKEPRNLSLQILESITENFSVERKIGHGGFGEVYKGVLQNGMTVAVKRIPVTMHTVDDKLFYREVKSLLKIIRHKNVVRFLGFCYNTHREVIRSIEPEPTFIQIRERLLCFEYISHGSLDRHITDEIRGLEWNIRYQIIRGICEGLQYLHEEMRIIHMDLKPANIMVDNQMVPKITDFGLSRLDEKSHTTGDHFGTRGYCAPEYENEGKMSFKSDMYSLGVVIIELVTGCKGFPDKNNVLQRWRHRWNESARHTPLQAQQVTKCIEIAKKCMEEQPKCRPSVQDIIHDLKEIENTNGPISVVGQELRPSSSSVNSYNVEQERSYTFIGTGVSGSPVAQQPLASPTHSFDAQRDRPSSDRIIALSQVACPSSSSKKRRTEHLFPLSTKHAHNQANNLRFQERVSESHQAINLATGAMGSLILKLGVLLRGEYNLQTMGVKEDAESLERKLMSMHAALEKVAEVPWEQLDKQVKLWADEVREQSYDMEDTVDGSEPSAKLDILKRLVKKIGKLFKKGEAQHQIANAIKEIKVQIQDTAARCDRYKVDPILLAMYKDQKDLVGIKDARDVLTNKLIDGDNDLSNQKNKILSIVGFGGLGKTTLAKVVYDRLQAKFDCRAFVPVGQNPHVKKVLMDIIFELDEKMFKDFSATQVDERQLVKKLHGILQNKRYVIVIDDLWDEQAWKTIRCALVDSNCGSRIITTTRKVSISKVCCSSDDDIIYEMKPLSDDDSKRLFYKRIFSRENGCPLQLEQVSRDILKKCGGVPLAITTIASLLATNKEKGEDYWHALLKSIGRGLTEDASMEEMQRILSFSYYDLPSHLKTCLLYLSIFPEDYEIKKDRLIWRWIAEGFVQNKKQDTSLFETGESYFNELINRSMIKPEEISNEGIPLTCRVHDMVLDLICKLSVEENFVTILDDNEQNTSNLHRKVRRLSIQRRINTPQLATMSMSHMRSFTSFGPGIGHLMEPCSAALPVLRVLDIEVVGDDKNCKTPTNLGFAGNLVQLRYLRLRNISGSLPMEIGKLKFLQILDLRSSGIKELPLNVVELRNLICLHIDCNTRLPMGMGNLTSLQVLTRPSVGNDSPHISKELVHLTNLKELVIVWTEDDALMESLGNLCKLQSLKIYAKSAHIDLLRGGWVPPPCLRRFETDGNHYTFLTLPTWITSLSLPFLTYLDIKVYAVRRDDVQTIGMLPALRFLNLLMTPLNIRRSRAPGEAGKWEFSANAFPCARECRFQGFPLLPCLFPPGAMPRVQTLEFWIGSWWIATGKYNLGMGHLPSLETVKVVLPHRDVLYRDFNACAEEVERAADLVTRAAHTHPNRLTIHTKMTAQTFKEYEEEYVAGGLLDQLALN